MRMKNLKIQKKSKNITPRVLHLVGVSAEVSGFTLIEDYLFLIAF